MKRFKSWSLIILMFLMSGWSQSYAYELVGFVWDSDYVDVYFNDESLPESYAADDPRVAGASSPEARREAQIRIFEYDIRRATATLSSAKGSVVVSTYKGRTNEPCSGWITGAIITCFREDHGHPQTFVRIRNGVVIAGKVILDAEIDSKYRDFNYVTLVHEYMHNLGFDHEDDVISIMNSAGSSTMTPLYEDDIAGFQHLYPFTKDCAPYIEMDEHGELGFQTQIYFAGIPYEGRLNYRNSGGPKGSLVVGSAVAFPEVEQPCFVKVVVEEVDGVEVHKLHYPYIWHRVPDEEGEMVWTLFDLDLEIQIDTLTFKIVDYQPVD